MTDTKALARRLAIEKAVLDVLTVRNREARERLTAQLQRGDRLTVRDGDDKVAAVGLSDPQLVARIVNRAALQAYAITHIGPHAVEEYQPEPVTRLRPEVEDRLLKQALADGGIVDPATGEISDMPGVRVMLPDPVLSVKVEPDFAPRLAHLVLGGHPELTAGD